MVVLLALGMILMFCAGMIFMHELMIWKYPIITVVRHDIQKEKIRLSQGEMNEQPSSNSLTR